MLLFTISRVNYNIKQRKLIKNNKRFDFEKILYADKFLYENRLKDEEMNNEIQKLREKQKEIREKIKHYNEFYKGLSLFEIMDVTKAFIENQSEDFLEINDNGEDQNMKEDEIKSPNQLGKLGIKSQEFK